MNGWLDGWAGGWVDECSGEPLCPGGDGVLKHTIYVVLPGFFSSFVSWACLQRRSAAAAAAATALEPQH